MKDFGMKILNGMSLGIVGALIPAALLGALLKALGLISLAKLTGATTSLLPAAIGIAVAHQFRLNPLQMLTLASATMIGSGVIKFTETGLLLKGTGDVINAGITAAIGVYVINLIGNKAKDFAILCLPIVVSIGVGFIGVTTLPYVASVTGMVGSVIAQMTEMQPIAMGVLLAMSFSFLIISPFSTVGIALAVGLSGIASGTANLGVVAAAFTLAVSGYSINGLGLSLAPVLGSPKIHMGNLAKNPKIIIPVLINAAVLGALGAIFNITGTAFSAGFGISGLVGPINALNGLGWTPSGVIVVTLLFVVVPLALAFTLKKALIGQNKLIKDEDYQLENV